MAKAEPPLSPHIQIYRWYFTMALSIAHRATGIVNSVMLLLLSWWLLALAAGPEAFGTVSMLVDSWLGTLILLGYTPVLFFHMGNGVRHLVWDAGYGFDPEIARQSGLAVLIFAGAMTVVVWLVVLIV
jgi:succinate dehydrogenase / fumarate reductase cytochrome b subunit